jgi:phospholipid/cholesterol/gamma-HCH transport system permease protein
MPLDGASCSFSGVSTLIPSRRSSIEVRRDSDDLVVTLGGDWNIHSGIASISEVEGQLTGASAPRRISYVADDVGVWDSALLTMLLRIADAANAQDVPEDRSGLPDGVQGMLRLAEAVPEKGDAKTHEKKHVFFVTQVGLTTIEVTESLTGMLDFIGEVTVAWFKWMAGRASYRKADLWLAVQQAGVEAMPIVALVSFLMGVILAFVGAIQLQQFGAAIYVADLVGIAMVRDVSALMTGIVMAGRSGAAYAAEIGSMQVNEEVDALTTIGVSPVEFLVLPRIIALVSMMPLLTIYSDFVAILGGMFVGVTMLDQSFAAYALQTEGAVTMTHVVSGLVKGTTYGAIVAMAGCLRGLQSGRSSLAVGAAATSAVVTAIVLIIAAAGIFSVLSYVLGI